MVNARLHIICGNCGCNHMFEYAVFLSINDAVDPNEEFQDVSITCNNCATIHYLKDNADMVITNDKNMEDGFKK